MKRRIIASIILSIMALFLIWYMYQEYNKVQEEPAIIDASTEEVIE